MRIFVAGGTGVVGRPLVEELVKRGHEVTATTRKPENFPAIEALGASPVTMDGLDEASVREAVAAARPEILIHQLTALSGPSNDFGAWLATTNRLRREGGAHLMAAAQEAGTRRFIAQSVSFMAAPGGSSPSDESSPLYLDAPEPFLTHIRSNVAMEEVVTNTPGVEGLVLRYGIFYGHGTSIGPGGDIATAIAAGQLPVIGAGTGNYPLLHLRDAVSATVQALDNGSTGIYNVMDDNPAPQREWVPYLAELLGAPQPGQMSEEDAAAQIGPHIIYYAVTQPPSSNAKAKAELGWTLEFPSWRDGFKDVFDSN